MDSEFDLERMVETIVEDRVHGADWLSNESLNVLSQIALHAPANNMDQLKETLRLAARKLAYARPSMGSVKNRVFKIRL